MAERTLRGDEEQEVEKLARVISNSLDDALITTGLIPATECLPYDMLAPRARDAIKIAAKDVYMQLAINNDSTFHGTRSTIVVIPKTGV